jgi:hypothetical protein
MPAWETILRTEKAARGLVFTPEEADLFVREARAGEGRDENSEVGPVPVETVERLVKDWHEILDELVQGSSGPSTRQRNPGRSKHSALPE